MKSVPHTLVQLTTNPSGLPCRTFIDDFPSLGEANAERRRILDEDDPEATVEVVRSSEWHGWA